MTYVKSANRVMEILQLLSQFPRGLTLSIICEKMEMAKSSAHEIVHAMEQQNFLQLDNKKYKLGIRVFELGQSVSRNLDILQVIRPHLKWLSSQSSMTTQFGILEKTDVIYLAKITKQGGVAVESQAGAKMPAHATALGKAMLSLLDQDILLANYSDYVFKKFTLNTIASLPELRSRLKKVREKKFAEDNQEYTKGIFCISIPVSGIRANTIGAISISMSEENWKQVDREKIMENLEVARTRILLDTKAY